MVLVRPGKSAIANGTHLLIVLVGKELQIFVHY